MPCHNQKYLWDKKGLGDQKDSEDFRSFDQYFDKNNDWNKRKYLKIDCEGCEWPALDRMDEKTLAGFDHITAELHWLASDRDHSTESQIRVLKKLSKLFYMYHIHGTNRAYVTKGPYIFPLTIEVGYIRKDLITD
jgi:hypothetical protein